ncbi:MAG: hypothetical protein ABIZ04_24965 [Opitutus sp.]
MKSYPLPDAVALSSFEVGLIRTSFRAVEHQSGLASQRFYRELFSYDPALRNLFAPDPWTREDQLMNTIGDIVEQLDSTDAVSAHLRQLVQRFPAYALNRYYHLYVGAALFAMLEDILGAKFSSEVYGAWYKLFQRAVVEVKSQAQENGPTKLTARPFAHPTAA